MSMADLDKLEKLLGSSVGAEVLVGMCTAFRGLQEESRPGKHDANSYGYYWTLLAKVTESYLGPMKR